MSEMDWKHTGRFCVGAFCMDFASGMYIVALPYLAIALGADSMGLGLVGALRGTYVVGCLAAALLSDRVNRRVLIAISAVGVVLMLVATAGAWRFWILCVVIVLWALSGSFYWPSLFSWLGDSHTRRQLGRATGAVNVSWSSGSLLGVLVGGWLYGVGRPLPFLVAVAPVALAFAVVALSPSPHARPTRVARGRSEPGTRRVLAAAWLGNASSCCLVGLMGSVFPELGLAINVNEAAFGRLMAGMGLGRTFMFLLGFRWSRWLQDWRKAAAAQLLGAAMVATVAKASAQWWLAMVFLSVGFALGVNYYRGLYKSLEGEGSRGLRVGLHEAALLGGITLGSLGGGALAEGWGLRAPYVPIAVIVAVLVAVQCVLLASANTALKKANSPDAPQL